MDPRLRGDDNKCEILTFYRFINDSMGHEAGDHLLKQVAGRLKSFVREIDTIARMGGDEFAILLEAASTPQDVKTIAQRIQAALARPYDLGGRRIESGASIGVVMNIAAYKNLDDIVRDADTAMYPAKASGGINFTVFGEDTGA